ncbi:cardiolipin synthase [Oscillospiraceae bacterium MB08-C2-2]|nr:cardiolipin synthase [Oscillospiraceae bacterium MB08-C2-2]
MNALKRIVTFLFSRLFVVALMLLVQMALLIAVLTHYSQNAIYLYLGLNALSFFAVMGVVSNHENPAYKMTWIIAIMLFPLTGGVFYLLLGNKRIPHKMRNKIKNTSFVTREFHGENRLCETQLEPKNSQLAIQSRYIYNVSGFTAMGNTANHYYALGDDAFPHILEQLKKAEKFIFLEYFIIRPGRMWNTILGILQKKAADGVEVRVMYDDIGCINTLPPEYDQLLEKSGIKVRVFNPFRPRLTPLANYRDHRKILVVDGNVAFSGGYNLADEYINEFERFGHWKDTGFMLQGDGVWSFTFMFLQQWVSCGKTTELIDYDAYRPTLTVAEQDGLVQAFDDSPLDRFNVCETIYRNMLSRAQRYIYIATPYLILDSDMENTLCNAAQMGLDVRILTPSIPDKWYVHLLSRSYYNHLIQAGITIYEYSPGFMHGKMIVADDEIATVGTCNMDFRSFYLHYECGAVFYLSSMVGKVKADMEATFAVSHKVTLEEARKISLPMRVVRAFIKLFAPLM